MANFERYSKLHGEIMDRLENGDITVEQAKTLNDKIFDKYVSESSEVSVATEYFQGMSDYLTECVEAGKYILGSIVIESADNADNSAIYKKFIEKVGLAQSFFDAKMDSIKNDITNATTPAEKDALKKALNAAQEGSKLCNKASKDASKIKSGDESKYTEVVEDIKKLNELKTQVQKYLAVA